MVQQEAIESASPLGGYSRPVLGTKMNAIAVRNKPIFDRVTFMIQ
jgi:hypothetical protein